MAEEENQTKKKNKTLITLSVIASIYILGVLVFSFITLPNTTINGKDESYANKSSVLANSREDFSINIKGRDDKSLSFETKDINYEREVPKEASLDQNPFTRPRAFIDKDMSSYQFNFKSNYDQAKLDQLLKESQLFQNVTEPKDAKIVKKGEGFEIEKEVEGDKPDFEKVKNKIISSLETNQKEVKLDDSDYLSPKIKADDEKLKKSLKDINDICKLTYKFDVKGFDIELKGDELFDLFDQNEDSSYVLDYDKLIAYLKKVADKVDTYGHERKFKATDVGEITVGPGVYGRMMDVKATADKVFKLVDQRKSGDIEPVRARKGYVRTDDGGDIGDTYLEIDLSRQHVRFYKEGKLLVSTDVVTGRLGHATNKGVGSILSREHGTTLKGEDFDGSQYNTPVKYRMPIGRDGEGLHDSDRRYSYGGTIYLYSGSHGCINTPPDQVAVIFDNIDVNTPVIVYESTTDNSPAMTY